MDKTFAQPAFPPGAFAAPPVPAYLEKHYWWAYVRPKAVRFWDRPWLVNLILLTNYRTLRDAALAEIGEGRVLQVACVYGDLTPHLAQKVAALDGRLDVADVLPVQLANLKRKLRRAVRLYAMDSTALEFDDASYDTVLLFFLLHEQPAAVRQQTVLEALRVMRPGGKLVIVDFAKPYRWNPLRYLWRVFLAIFEPFALGMWRIDMASLVPAHCQIREQRYFGGLFRKTVIHK